MVSEKPFKRKILSHSEKSFNYNLNDFFCTFGLMKSKILAIVSFISISIYGLELPKKMLLFNPIDIAQQKFSFSYLKQTKKLNYLQVNGNVRLITNYEYMPDYKGITEPSSGNGIQPFGRLYGFHIGAGVGYKLINKKQVKQHKVKYWQPMISAKFAQEDLVLQRIFWNAPTLNHYNNHHSNNVY